MPVALAVPFIAVIVALAAWQIAKTWDATFGPLLKDLADRVDVSFALPVIHKPISFGWLATAIRNTEASIRNTTSAWVAAVSAPLVHALRALANAFTYPARELAGLATDVAHTLAAYRRVIVPALIAAKVAWLPRHLAMLDAKIARLALRAPVHIVHAIEHVVRPSIVNIVQKAVALPFPRIGRLERQGHALGKRIDRLAHRVTPAALAAAVGLTLARIGAGWLRCSRVKRVGRQVCGMDTQILDALLADTALIVGTVSLVEFAHGMQSVMDEITGPVRHFWTADIRDTAR